MVEFAMVAAPFLALLFAIAETSLIFFAGQTLETATADSARLILTGQAAGYDATAFKDQVCSRLHGLFGGTAGCKTNLMVDVRNYGKSFGTKPAKPTPDPVTGKLPDDFYDAGGPNCVVVVRVMYQWPVWVTLNGLDLSDVAKGKRLLMATAAFRSEPYGTPTC